MFRGFKQERILIDKFAADKIIDRYSSQDQDLGKYIRTWLCEELIPVEMKEIQEVGNSGDKIEKKGSVDIREFCSNMIGNDMLNEDIELYRDMLSDLTKEINPHNPLLEEANIPSLIAIVAWSCKREDDEVLEEWIPDYFKRIHTYEENQAENFKAMKVDFLVFELLKKSLKPAPTTANEREEKNMETKHYETLTREMIDDFNKVLVEQECAFKFSFDRTDSGSGLGMVSHSIPNSKGVKTFHIVPSYDFYMWAAVWFKEKYGIRIRAFEDGAGVFCIGEDYKNL